MFDLVGLVEVVSTPIRQILDHVVSLFLSLTLASLGPCFDLFHRSAHQHQYQHNKQRSEGRGHCCILNDTCTYTKSVVVVVRVHGSTRWRQLSVAMSHLDQ